mmetsp:Transcript_25391/g.24331  ORF Transcript_25391/g.24331 Transcript_25391/m.24331 type:complete len:288 (-) Transcript_25391:121-984(-)|eukprot:CAMPEP_0197833254 /NCGR_PEP_ID=MMETSP1437-20131217/18367_1 /TAXON_ID=49252 ORGANISM="Eucampia antarctica, Strain CCMP1452" /NCGR_SAMPLE_ID=MMETSP1437 /ASSEMBLY_ACC=CAM_ASM_001096 /LENGTH=287 /DNA_ID=CAMNT_0043437211 /DNA_START=126 /DNA_END=989 /DNA_ORIENTATION=-
MTETDYLPMLITFLCADFRWAKEFQAFTMAIQGAMIVRTGPNKDGTMAWFHAFAQSVVSAYAGALAAPLLMGRPTSMLSNDVNLAMCIIAFILVNCIPFDLGFKILRTFPMRLLTTIGAQLFRAMGVIGFTSMGYETLKHAPSKYYPTPIVGPILWATLLGNMGGFFSNGFERYLKNGMPWPFQNGFFCASLFLFTVHDQGPIGQMIRDAIDTIPGIKRGYDDKIFATIFVSGFMQIMAILRMPEFLGPTFSPFNIFHTIGSQFKNKNVSIIKSGKRKKNKKKQKNA